MSVLTLPKDLEAFMLRVTASMDNFDNFVREGQMTFRNINEAVTEIRQAVARLKGQG